MKSQTVANPRKATEAVVERAESLDPNRAAAALIAVQEAAVGAWRSLGTTVVLIASCHRLHSPFDG